MKKVIGYLRLSKKERKESEEDRRAGLDAQRSAIEREAEYRGWDVEWITDDGMSARSLQRAGIQQALGMLSRGDCEGIVTAKLDRLSRSTADFAELLKRAEREGWKIVGLDFGLDTSSPAGEMVATMLMAAGQYERRMIGVRTREALVEVRKVKTLGRPRGVPASVVARIRELAGQGHNPTAIARVLTAEGVETPAGKVGRWRPQSVSVYCASAGVAA